ncbi:MAG: hypothetical protein JO027_22115 [Solirubrobacterales bacterium]|nr:hypothetical protein [Solirubrobacterales bacterium]
MTLRFGSLRVPTTVHWPRKATVSLALVLSDELSPADRWVKRHIVVGLRGVHPGAVELAVLEWVSEHAPELGAAGDRLLLAGGARAAKLALAMRDSDAPSPWHQLLVRPRFDAAHPMPTNLAGAPPATVVCDSGSDNGHAYAERLRAAAVEVEEVCDVRRR